MIIFKIISEKSSNNMDMFSKTIFFFEELKHNSELNTDTFYHFTLYGSVLQKQFSVWLKTNS